MAKKKVMVVRRRTSGSGGVPAKKDNDSFRYVIKEGQTQDQYRKLLASTNKLFAAAESSFVKFNTQRLVMMWEVGSQWQGFFSSRKNTRGQISDDDVRALAQDLDPFSSGQRVTNEVMRMCLRLTEAYPKSRIETLAQKGINENHISVFLQLEDTVARGKLEDRAIREQLNGNQCRQVVKEMAKDPAQAKYLAPNTRSRYKQEVSNKKNRQEARVSKPVKMIEYALGKMESEADNLADLLMALDNVKELDATDKKALAPNLDELITRLGGMTKTYGALKDAAYSALITCKQAPASPVSSPSVRSAVTADRAATSKAKKKKAKKKSSKKK